MAIDFELLSIALAACAAFFAFWAASIKAPRKIEKIDYGFIDPTKPKPVDDLDRLIEASSKQSKIAWWAAIIAIASAFFQVISKYA